MALKTFDPSQLVLSVGGVPASGWADGSMMTVEYDEDAYTKVVGVDQTTRVKSSNNGGKITIRLQQSSPFNDVLSAFAIADREDNSGVVPALGKDNSGRTVIFSPSAWVMKIPSAEFAKEHSDREWILDCADLELFVGGNS